MVSDVIQYKKIIFSNTQFFLFIFLFTIIIDFLCYILYIRNALRIIGAKNHFFGIISQAFPGWEILW